MDFIKQREIVGLCNSVIMVANKFIGKCDRREARSKETLHDLSKLKTEALLVKSHIEQDFIKDNYLRSMNTEQKREAIHLKVVEAIPEIMELKFGCYVLMKKHRGDDMDMVNASISKPVPIISTYDGVSGIAKITYVDNFGNVSTDGLERYDKGEEAGYTLGKSRIKEIIGRPITALDILRALEGNVLHEMPSISARGNLYFERIDLGRRWMLTLDLTQTLSEWSEETIDELYKLMCE